MKIYQNTNPKDAKHYDTTRLREEFLEKNLFQQGKITIVYSHIDRLVALGVCPTIETLSIDEIIDRRSFGTEYFLERRELGLVNLGGKVKVTCKDGEYELDHLDALYLGKETKNIKFTSINTTQENYIYCLSAPAHHKYPNRLIKSSDARKVKLGSHINANDRIVNQYLHPDVLDTCQLSMGITHLSEGSVWNTMPAHTHERRMEAYLYFNIQPSQVVFHFLGEPQETRHIVVRDKELIISPSWSIHSGCGTQHYSFVWGMIGENQTYDDMDFIDMNDLR